MFHRKTFLLIILLFVNAVQPSYQQFICIVKVPYTTVLLIKLRGLVSALIQALANPLSNRQPASQPSDGGVASWHTAGNGTNTAMTSAD